MKRLIMNIVAIRRVSGVFLTALSTLLLFPTTVRADAICAAISRQTAATVIAYEPPSSFTICRAGDAETDVVVGRPVYVELVARRTAGLFRFHVPGTATQAEPTGLRRAAERIDRLHAGLLALASSGETIAAAPPNAFAAANAVEQSRAIYLGVATPRFHEVLSAIAEQLEDLPKQAGMFSRWCTELVPAADTAQDLPELRQTCSDPRAAPASAEKDVSALTASIQSFHNARDVAREALVMARAKPDDAAAQGRAATALAQARHTAQEVVEGARRLAPVAALLASEAWLLREAARGATGTLTPGVPRFLTRFSRSGTALLRIDAEPIELLQSAQPDGKADGSGQSSETFHFDVVGLHFLDLEAGIGATDAPSVPAVGAQGLIEHENVDEFVGLALVEVEPARFLWPDRPIAGLLRFPVVGIPFTRDPTRNFFTGVGLGWTDVGSVSAGPYILRELTLDRGFAFGSSIAQGMSLASVASPQVRVGSFVSASVDLVALWHLIVAPARPLLDATSGMSVP